MEGYILFTRREVRLWETATALVASLPNLHGKVVRCHELARAVGFLLDLEVVDGHYGTVEHSWLYTCSKNGGIPIPGCRLRILDVYVPGGLPMVQLVDNAAYSLPTNRCYHEGPPRTDIDEGVVTELFGHLRSFRGHVCL